MTPLNTILRLTAATSLALATSAIGAPGDPVGQIMRIDGAAMISQGTRYVDAREGMPLRVQDRVLVLDRGGALLQFTDGCQYQLEDSELLTIGIESACAEKAAKTAAADQNKTGVSVETAATRSLGMAGRLEQGATSALGAGATTGGLLGGIGGASILGATAILGAVVAQEAGGIGSSEPRPNNRRPLSAE